VGQTPPSISRISRGGRPTRMPLMSALGQKQTFSEVCAMSALPPKSGHWASHALRALSLIEYANTRDAARAS
jgi:hypothetical protein